MLLCSSSEHYQKGWMTSLEMLRNKVRVGVVVRSIANVQCPQGEDLCLWACKSRSSLFINEANGYHKDPQCS